ATPAPATPEAAPATPATPVASEEDDWAKVKAAIWPAEVQQRAQAFLRDHPGSRFDGSAQAALEGAQEAARILQRPDVRLFRSAFQLPEGMPEEQRHDIVRAARGDKDAAARLGRNYLKDAGNGPYATRYEGWMQYAAALGNGIASYELSGFYRAADQPQLASRFESRSRELGYTPPPSLDNVRK
ncbi:MAG: hypothetical protein KGI67_11980, partial [Pseudomonadota bacterium]|nr:hypothetical protein [Pseudomonadota bacterium]